jgi:hypothetical protein
MEKKFSDMGKKCSDMGKKNFDMGIFLKILFCYKFQKTEFNHESTD